MLALTSKHATRLTNMLALKRKYGTRSVLHFEFFTLHSRLTATNHPRKRRHPSIHKTRRNARALLSLVQMLRRMSRESCAARGAGFQ